MEAKEAYCSSELRKLLIEHGFPEAEKITHQLALSWLRKEGYYINISSVYTFNWRHGWTAFTGRGTKIRGNGTMHDTFEEAAEEAMQYILTKWMS